MGRGEATETGMFALPITGGVAMLPAAAVMIECNERFLVLGHTSPDADSLASTLALTEALQIKGKDAIAFAAGVEPLPERLAFLGTERIVRELPEDLSERVVFVLDCALVANTGIAEELGRAKEVVQLDHHVADNERFGSVNVLENASSASEIVALLLEELDMVAGPEIASALYAGISADTGRFRYDNTSPRTLRVAAELVEAGADPTKIAESLFQEIPYRKLKLGSIALANSDLYSDGRVLVCRIRQADFKEHGLHENDGGRLIDQLRNVEGVQVVALIQERESRKQSGVFRVTLRSQNGGPDISEVAREFGGGGHRGAASFMVEMPIAELEEKLLVTLGQQL